MSSVAEAYSRDGVRLELRAKSWSHVVEAHDYMAGRMDLVLEAVSEPDIIIKGMRDEKLAVKGFRLPHLGRRNVVVVYRELSSEQGLIITAYVTSDRRLARLARRRGVLWSKH